ncbi:TRAP transporter small permease [Oceanobacillus sp. CF4.6]|uniref:TRAP transporter small permease n=1 Tax=Oceanobacillus sp. CF4.6 TaxID=3373080 RepID=UPI003EE6F1EF
MKKLNKIYDYFGYMKKFSLFLAGIALFGMIFFITIDVIMRNFSSTSIPGSYEIVQNYLMSVASFSVILYAYSSGVMPRISMVVERFPIHIQKTLHIAMLIIELLLMILVAYYTLTYAITGTISGFAFPAVGILFPLYPFLYIVPLGFGGIAIEIIFTLIKNIMSKEVWITFNKKQRETDAVDQSYVT